MGPLARATIALLFVLPLPAQTLRRALADAKQRLDTNDSAGAIVVLDPAIVKHPDIAELHYLRAVAKRQRGDHEGALADATRAVELEPDNTVLLIERGYLRRRTKDLEGAVRDFDAAIRLDPRNATAWGDRGDARQVLGAWRDARADYDEALRLRPDYSAAFENRAYVRSRLGDLLGAADDYREATRLLPPRAPMWIARANAERYLARWPAARASLDRAVEIARTTEPHELAWALHERALLRWRLDALAAAAADLHGAAEHSPEPRRALATQWLGAVALARGDAAGARRHFAAAAAAPGIAPWARLMEWCAADGSDTGADERLREALAALGELPPLLVHAGAVCTGTAPAELPADVAASPDHAFVVPFFAGCRAERSGDRAEALRQWRRCVNTMRSDAVQWWLAWTRVRAAAAAPFAPSLGLTVAAVEGAAVPTLEVTAVVDGGAAHAQGAQVGDRCVGVLDGDATPAAFAAATALAVVGTPLRIERVVRGKPVATWLWVGIE
jgi:tetratricopeptide (TPR) repeat protein